MRYREVMEKKIGASAAPKRIIFYRGLSLLPRVHLVSSDLYFYVDGVSEGQFKQVLELGAFSSMSSSPSIDYHNLLELPLLKSNRSSYNLAGC